MEPSHGVLSQVELAAEFVYDHVGVFSLVDAYLLRVLFVKLDLEYADGHSFVAWALGSTLVGGFRGPIVDEVLLEQAVSIAAAALFLWILRRRGLVGVGMWRL